MKGTRDCSLCPSAVVKHIPIIELSDESHFSYVHLYFVVAVYHSQALAVLHPFMKIQCFLDKVTLSVCSCLYVLQMNVVEYQTLFCSPFVYTVILY